MKIIPVLAVALTLLCAGPLSADAVSDWFALPQAAAYQAIRPETESLRDIVIAANVPSSLVAERLREGAAKKVRPERLIAALREDAERFVFLADSFDGLPPDIASQSERPSFIRDGSIALRSGIGYDAFTASLVGLDGGGLHRRVAALLAVAAVNARFPLSQPSVSRLARALDGSTERVERFSRLSSIFVRARASGLNQDELADRAVTVLSVGGNLFSLESAIEEGLR